jgi:hypothetical protein
VTSHAFLREKSRLIKQFIGREEEKRIIHYKAIKCNNMLNTDEAKRY